MRHPARSPLVLPAFALVLAACEPLPPGQPEFSPMIAPMGTGVGLPPANPLITGPSATGGFAPDPAGAPIIEERLTDVPGNTTLPPITPAPLNPAIGAAVESFNTPPGTSGPLQTVPLGSPVITPPLGTVPGGPLPEPRFRGSSLGAESPAVPRALPAPAPGGLGASSANAISVTPISATAGASGGISDEQDFDAVSRRESIGSDAERLARLRASRQEIAPEPVPQRPATVAPNIVGYALATANAVGQPAYRRSGLLSVARLRDACRRYASPDRAQEAFLASGGPRRDRQGLDPDGDGFACGWDPAPFRRAVN